MKRVFQTIKACGTTWKLKVTKGSKSCPVGKEAAKILVKHHGTHIWESQTCLDGDGHESFAAQARAKFKKSVACGKIGPRPHGKREQRRRARPRRRPTAKRSHIQWWDRPSPPTANCYRVKGDAARAFVDENIEALESTGGIDQTWGGGHMDSVNELYERRGKRRVTTLKEAIWLAIGTTAPYCFKDMNLEALNETTPGKEAGGFRIPVAEDGGYTPEEIEKWREAWDDLEGAKKKRK